MILLPSLFDGPVVFNRSYFDAEHKRWFEHPDARLFSRILSLAVIENAQPRDEFVRRLQQLEFSSLKGWTGIHDDEVCFR